MSTIYSQQKKWITFSELLFIYIIYWSIIFCYRTYKVASFHSYKSFETLSNLYLLSMLIVPHQIMKSVIFWEKAKGILSQKSCMRIEWEWINHNRYVQSLVESGLCLNYQETGVILFIHKYYIIWDNTTQREQILTHRFYKFPIF